MLLGDSGKKALGNSSARGREREKERRKKGRREGGSRKEERERDGGENAKNDWVTLSSFEWCFGKTTVDGKSAVQGYH